MKKTIFCMAISALLFACAGEVEGVEREHEGVMERETEREGVIGGEGLREREGIREHEGLREREGLREKEGMVEHED